MMSMWVAVIWWLGAFLLGVLITARYGLVGDFQGEIDGAAEAVEWRRVVWRRVGDGLPVPNETVVVFAPTFDACSWPAFYDGEEWYHTNGMKFSHAVSHWADLPQPPVNRCAGEGLR